MNHGNNPQNDAALRQMLAENRRAQVARMQRAPRRPLSGTIPVQELIATERNRPGYTDGQENQARQEVRPPALGGCRLCPENNSTESDNNESWGLYEYPLAMVYAPLQNWRNLYDHETALRRGTLFAELDLPFTGGRNGGNCRK